MSRWIGFGINIVIILWSCMMDSRLCTYLPVREVWFMHIWTPKHTILKSRYIYKRLLLRYAFLQILELTKQLPPKYSNYNKTIFYNCMCVCMLSLQSCPTLCDPMDCSPPNSSASEILQAKILEWVALPSSRGSSWHRDWTCVSNVSRIAEGFFTTEPVGQLIFYY